MDVKNNRFSLTMKTIVRSTRFQLTIAALSILIVSAGCKKKAPAVDIPIPVETTAAETAAHTAPAAQQVDPITPVDSRIAEAQAALKAQDYERAAAALAIPPTAPVPMTGQQLMSLNAAKTDLINRLGAAAATGDPKAVAAYRAMQERLFGHH